MAKNTEISDDDLKYHLINKYRELISKRYDKLIDNIDEAPLQIEPQVAKELKTFFLEHIYPEPVERRKLDAAFSELGNFVHNPALIWGLIGSLPMAIFKFGAQLPNAIVAGLKSLEAYSSTTGFENALLQGALDKGYTIPVTDEQFLECLKSIPRKNLDNFIAQVSVLFTTISNTTLLSKTMEIMEDVIKRMKAKPQLYNEQQIAAIQLGLDLMSKGYDLLSPYDDNTRKEIVSFVASTEADFIALVYEEK